MKATELTGTLRDLSDCYISFPRIKLPAANSDPGGVGPPAVREVKIYMNILPDISDQKSAGYADEPAIGRSFPFKTFTNGENRTIGWTAHFVATKETDFELFLGYIRAIQSAVYPMEDGGGAPFAPPPIARLRCGKLLSRDSEVCAVLKSYDIKYDPSVPWDERTYLPYKFDISMSFEVVYNQTNLPGSETIFRM